MAEQKQMPDDVNTIEDLVKHSLEQDYNKANEVFGTVMTTKLSDVLDQAKVKLAGQIYNGDPEDVEDPLEDEDFEEDDNESGDEDEVIDDENEEVDDFDERKILDELTGTHSIGSQNEAIGKDTEKDESNAAPAKKKAVKKRVAKKGVAKKIVKRPSANISSSEPEVNMGKGIKSINCPSCDKIHNVDENTTKFICSCGRRIRV